MAAVPAQRRADFIPILRASTLGNVNLPLAKSWGKHKVGTRKLQITLQVSKID